MFCTGDTKEGFSWHHPPPFFWWKETSTQSENAGAGADREVVNSLDAIRTDDTVYLVAQSRLDVGVGGKMEEEQREGRFARVVSAARR